MAAGRPPSLRTRPCLARRATAGSPPAATWSARVPHQQVLQQPTSRVGSRHAARAAATRRDRHQRQPATLLRYPALVGCRVTQHLAARAQAGLRIDRRRRDRDSRFTRRAGGLKATIAQKPTLERLGVQPEAHERGAAQAAGARSARTLAPACLRMACASSEATARCGHRNPVGYARFAPPAVTPAIAVTPRNNPCVTCVTCVTRRMYVCLGGGERGPKFH